MFPNVLIVDHFLYKTPLDHSLSITQVRQLNAFYSYRSQYLYSGFMPIPPTLVSSIFVCGNFVYKVKTTSVKIDPPPDPPSADRIYVRGQRDYTFAAIDLEEYTDDYVDKLKERLKQIKEHMSVYMDNIEELGGVCIANKFRGYAKELMLEDLVPGIGK